MSKPATFSIIGGAGFRAQAYLRVAKELPEHFRVSGMVVRDSSKASTMQQLWNVAAYPTLEQLLEQERPDFVVVSAGKGASTAYFLELAARGIPALVETPPADDLEGLLQLHEKLTATDAKIQVAEQYHLQPMHAARISVIESGRLGPVTEATVSISQTYHAVSLIRKMLGIRFEEAEIRGKRFEVPLVAGPGRAGAPTEEKLIRVPRDLAWIDFGEKLGIYDFTKDQHRSWIRSNHLSVRGQRGEIFDNRLDVLADYRTPLHLQFNRINKGEMENMEGFFLQGIMAGERWAYVNPFRPARLSDDEIAVADCLRKMVAYVNGGPSFYGLPDASQDHYLGMLIEKAIETGEPVTAVRQPWACD